MATTETSTKNPGEVKDEITSSKKDFTYPDSSGDEATFLLKNQIIQSLITNREQRIRYARRTFWLTVGWIFLVILIVAASGIDIKIAGQNRRLLMLSDTVVVTLITTTTLNVFGFFLLVMQYLFNNKELESLRDIFKD